MSYFSRLSSYLWYSLGIVFICMSFISAKETSPKLVWQIQIRDFPLALVQDSLRKHYLYTAIHAGGLSVIKQTDNSAKQVANLSKKDLGDMHCTNIAQTGNILYLSLGNFFQKSAYTGLASVDVTDPEQPKILHVWKSKQKSHGSHSIILGKHHAYLCAMEHGIFIFDISTPQMKLISSIVPDLTFPKKNYNSVSRPNARHACLKGNTLYVAFDAGGVRAIDVRNPRQPVEIGKYINKEMLHKQQAYNEIIINGNTAYVSTDYAGMEILDISNPKKMRRLSWWNPWEADGKTNIWSNSPGHGHQLSYHAKSRSLMMSAGDSELIIIDVSNSKKPFYKSSYGKPKNKHAAWGAYLGKDKIYLCYIKAFIPFKGTWSGIKAVTIPR